MTKNIINLLLSAIVTSILFLYYGDYKYQKGINKGIEETAIKMYSSMVKEYAKVNPDIYGRSEIIYNNYKDTIKFEIKPSK